MTNWGALLLVAYVALGLSRWRSAKAMRWARWLTVIVITVVMVRTAVP
jgi:hypothetical protein